MSRLAACVGLFTALSASIANAACGNLSNVCSFAALESCCGTGSICDINGPVTLAPGGICTIDFGLARSVRVVQGGSIVVGTGTATILAANLTVSGNGQLTAAGDATHDSGKLHLGTALRPLTSFTMQNTAVVSVAGGGAVGGGILDVVTKEAINITSSATPAIDARATDNVANGGEVTLVSQSNDVIVNGKIWALSMSVPFGDGGGGSIILLAGRNLRLEIGGDLSARGGSGLSGKVDLRATGAVTLAPQSTIDASAHPSTEGDGGSIDINGASLDALGTIASDGGSSASPADSGGIGGSIDLSASTGHLLVQHGVKGLSADGAPGAEGGPITLTTRAMTNPSAVPPTDGTLTIDAPVSSIGKAVIDGLAGGGDITISSSGDFILAGGARTSVDGAGDSGGGIDITATRDVILHATISADSDETAGNLTVRAEHDVVFDGNVSLDGQTNASGGGGDLSVLAGNDIRVLVGRELSAKGAVTDAGGSISLRATQRVRIDNAATLIVDGGDSQGARAGTIALTSNAGEHGGPASYAPDPDFDLIVEGNLRAVGHNACSGVTSTNAAKIALTGCRIQLANAVLDSRGDCYALNALAARQSIIVNAGSNIRTTGAGSQARTTILTKTGVDLGGVVSGAFTPAYQSAVAAECVAVNTPADCLAPCPTCGDGTITAPWETCDTALGRCEGHCNHCRAEVCGNGNPCLRDDCDALGGCINTWVPDGTTCDDNNVCTLVDQCQSGNCVRDTVSCFDGIPCTADQCDPVTGCFHPNNGGPTGDGTGVTGCDDASFCNGDEVCMGSTCHAGDPPTCHEVPTDDPDTRDSCTSNNCMHEPAHPCAVDAECEDGNVCTTDTCVLSPALNVKVCRTTPANGTACQDGNACTVADTCQNGTCVRGADLPCDDSLVCTTDTCDPQSGCVHADMGGDCCEDAMSCHGGTSCTTATCTNHHCGYAEIPDCCANDAECDDQNPCTLEPAGICDVASHQCAPRTPLTGAQPGCGDLCQPGQCVAAGATSTCQLGAPIQCQDDGNWCTREVCDPAVGCHQREPNCCMNVADCPDDGNTCTQTTCTDNHLCEHPERFADCRSCRLDTDCDPLGRCGGKFCDATGVCLPTPTPAPTCSDNNLNTRDACIPVEGAEPRCENTCLNATACDDGNACNGAESCSVGACQPGTTLNCDDGDTCSTDACNPIQGCTNTFRVGFDRIRCRLDSLSQLITAADSTSLQTGVRKKLTAVLTSLRKKAAKAQVLKDQNNPAAKKPLKAMVKQSKRFQALLKKHRGKKIAAALADTLQTVIGDVINQTTSQLP